MITPWIYLFIILLLLVYARSDIWVITSGIVLS